MGPRSLEMGFNYARSTEILAQARPLLRRLAEKSRETVKLGMPSDNQVVIVAAVESTPVEGRLSSLSTSAGRPALPTDNPTSSRNRGAAWTHTSNDATVLQLQFGHSRQFDEVITRFRGLPDNFVASGRLF